MVRPVSSKETFFKIAVRTTEQTTNMNSMSAPARLSSRHHHFLKPVRNHVEDRSQVPTGFRKDECSARRVHKGLDFVAFSFPLAFRTGRFERRSSFQDLRKAFSKEVYGPRELGLCYFSFKWRIRQTLLRGEKVYLIDKEYMTYSSH